MSRIRRESYSGFYHLIMRGINRQNIFEDNEDRLNYINIIFHFAEETGCSISAWCLMTNHIHLLVHSDKIPSDFVKKVGCAYVPYFNNKYERVGSLFQGRYHSELVDTVRYLIGVTRYIHMNPEKAGICKMEKYPWSSYNDYVQKNGKTDIGPIMQYFNSVSEFEQTMRIVDETRYLECKRKLTEEEATEIAKKVISHGVFSAQNYNKEKKIKIIKQLLKYDLTPSQICRITGISKHIVYEAIK